MQHVVAERAGCERGGQRCGGARMDQTDNRAGQEEPEDDRPERVGRTGRGLGARGIGRTGAVDRQEPGGGQRDRPDQQAAQPGRLWRGGQVPAVAGQQRQVQQPIMPGVPGRPPARYAGAGPVEARTTSSGRKTYSECGAGSPLISSTSARTAAVDIASTGCCTVVSGGSVKAISGESS